MKKTLLLIITITLLCFSKYSKGQVGINVTAPSATLDILTKGNDAATKALSINNSSNANLVTILNNGRLGINNTTPTTRLHVTGDQMIPTLQASASIATFTASNGALDLFSDINTPYGFGFQSRDVVKNTSLSILLNPVGGNVGIGVRSPNSGAILDLTSTTKGLLIPRVSLTSTTTWGLDGTATDGMMVYNTNTSISGDNANGKNFYVWQGSKWQAMYVNNGRDNSGNMGRARFTSVLSATGTFSFPFFTYRAYRVNISGSLTSNSYKTFTDEYLITLANNVSHVSIQQTGGVYSEGNAQTMQSAYMVSSFTITPTHGLYTINFDVQGAEPKNMVLTNKSNATMDCRVLLSDLW
ncbi:hypothetical protein [Apibacter sp. HY039]|uniref:hypothetical protein n=1 Tax=Apibacter sp. HY039 TaxID=2501476 RepID=UPI000FEB90A5|nr:hypothetical protein [Apibacter sp. HY039]